MMGDKNRIEKFIPLDSLVRGILYFVTPGISLMNGGSLSCQTDAETDRRPIEDEDDPLTKQDAMNNEASDSTIQLSQVVTRLGSIWGTAVVTRLRNICCYAYKTKEHLDNCCKNIKEHLGNSCKNIKEHTSNCLASIKSYLLTYIITILNVT